MKTFVCVILALLVNSGCARLRVVAPKEPIKVDVSMRLDIYQHVVKDIDNIENIVSNPKDKTTANDKNSLLHFFVGRAWAQAEEKLSPEVESAALRRRNRYQRLRSLEGSGVVGENKLGLVEIRKPAEAGSEEQELVRAENNDRLFIYQAIANKNNLSLEEVEKLYAKRLQTDAPSGSPIEVLDETSGAYKWKTK